MAAENARVSFTELPGDVEIRLTGSKSESNRALILAALSGGTVQVRNLSEAADTVTLKTILDALSSGQINLPTLNVGPAGTAMRFLTAYIAAKGIPRAVTLSGSERMKQRPIGVLTAALHTLGANLSFPGNPGFPPVTITGPFKQATGKLTVPGNISSQYITALLLVAPSLEMGLELSISGELTSRPYVEMTLGLMEQCGIRYTWTGDTIVIRRQALQTATLTVEPDWSAASYWYSIAALSAQARIRLPFLRASSLQGDSAIARIMEQFGVFTTYEEEAILIEKKPFSFSARTFDFKDCPDLAQTVIVCCAALGYDSSFTGLETLKIKETDRVSALQCELAKIGVTLTEDKGTYRLDSSGLHFPERLFVHTYEDHRMAMAFAPLAMKVAELEVEEKDVVAKSYPDFWKHLETAGFITNN